MTLGALRPRRLDPLRRVQQRFAMRRLARRQALLQQAPPEEPSPEPAALPAPAGPPTIRMTVPMVLRSEIEVNGHRIYLTPTEAAVASTLLMMRPRPLRAEQLCDLIYADDPEGGPLHKVMDVFVCRLRRKGVPVQTRFGMGYTL